MIVFASRTGNIRNIISKLPSIHSVELEDDMLISKPYFIFTYTDGLGDVPSKVLRFLDNNKLMLKGVIASGNTNFGSTFCRAANTISLKYNVPIIRKIDLRGNSDDIKAIIDAHKIRIEGEKQE